MGCGGNGDRILRHDSIRDAVFSAAQSADLAPRKEVPSLIPGTLSRPADIFLPNWQRGQPAALDVTVISTLQSCRGQPPHRVMPWWLVLRGSLPPCGGLPCCWHCIRSFGGRVPWRLEQRGSRHHHQDWAPSG